MAYFPRPCALWSGGLGRDLSLSRSSRSVRVSEGAHSVRPGSSRHLTTTNGGKLAIFVPTPFVACLWGLLAAGRRTPRSGSAYGNGEAVEAGKATEKKSKEKKATAAIEPAVIESIRKSKERKSTLIRHGQRPLVSNNKKGKELQNRQSEKQSTTPAGAASPHIILSRTATQQRCKLPRQGINVDVAAAQNHAHILDGPSPVLRGLSSAVFLEVFRQEDRNADASRRFDRSLHSRPNQPHA